MAAGAPLTRAAIRLLCGKPLAGECDLGDEEAVSAGPAKWVVPAWEVCVCVGGWVGVGGVLPPFARG
jgi:hypothetical protein